MGDHPADAERAALVALLDDQPSAAAEGPDRWAAIAAEVALRGSAIALWHDHHPPTPALDGDPERTDPRTDIAWRRLHEWATDTDGARLITILDDDYPVALRGIHQMPPLLFVKGALSTEETAVSIVGARAATADGRRFTIGIAEGLVARGVSVLSGLSVGIDAAAHEATLRAGGRPIGVLATGIRRASPPAHVELSERVAAAGALVSQFPPLAGPTRRSFAARNAVMSGLGRATIIVEAGEHSGTRTQARAAVGHGRPVILTESVAAGTHWGRALTGRPGVHVAASADEVLAVVDQILADRGAGPEPVLPPAPSGPTAP
ncbi:DNA-processing protein DprA [Mycolicibacterium llatzerense]|uniref:DNA-processing protein DprA n=1 Tax=Mycolicibacterium llatzerense TaxID=280871 RepID=UPI0008DCA933|nr:DNA-processing protein DprA [Mycolicibacterium llatzerense]